MLNEIRVCISGVLITIELIYQTKTFIGLRKSGGIWLRMFRTLAQRNNKSTAVSTEAFTVGTTTA